MAETNSVPLDAINKDGSEILKNSVQMAKQVEELMKQLEESKKVNAEYKKANDAHHEYQKKQQEEFAKTRQADVDYVLKWQTQDLKEEKGPNAELSDEYKQMVHTTLTTLNNEDAAIPIMASARQTEQRVKKAQEAEQRYKDLETKLQQALETQVWNTGGGQTLPTDLFFGGV